MKPTDENEKLPTWVVEEMSDPNRVDDMKALMDLATKIGKHAKTINGVLSNKMEKHPDPNKVIVLGVDMLDEVSNIKATIDQVDNLDLTTYFSIMSQVLESFERLVFLNTTNLGNGALRKHLIRMFNKTLLDTRVLVITNAYLSKFWEGGSDLDEDNEPEDPEPRAS